MFTQFASVIKRKNNFVYTPILVNIACETSSKHLRQKHEHIYLII